ncbi:hypothetical protein EGW08_023483, partial [Elysia chlorotica]
MKFDDILAQQTGEFGPYQARVYVLACLPLLTQAIMSILPVFTLASLRHRCAIPGLPNDTYAVQSERHQQLINASIPWEKDGDGWARSSCYMYRPGNNITWGPQV